MVGHLSKERQKDRRLIGTTGAAVMGWSNGVLVALGAGAGDQERGIPAALRLPASIAMRTQASPVSNSAIHDHFRAAG